MIRKSIVTLVWIAGASISCWIGAADQSVPRGAQRVAPVSVGDLAPDFTLEDQDGRRYTLSAERGKRPVVLVFYRGHW